jgi:hypothetical protein
MASSVNKFQEGARFRVENGNYANSFQFQEMNLSQRQSNNE